MSLSSLYKFVLSLKGRGFSLSPKEVEFLKKLLLLFPEEEIKQKLKKCYKEIIPPHERERSPITRCASLFKKEKKNRSKVYLQNLGRAQSVKEALSQLSPEDKKKVEKELKEFFGNREPSPEEVEGVLRVLLRKYL